MEGNSNQFINNTCITNSKDGGFSSDCDISEKSLMTIAGNRIYTADGSLGGTKICDDTNTVAAWPTADVLVEMACAVLNWTSR